MRKLLKNNLSEFIPAHRFFVGVDSDGCVFDTMEIKQKKCFHPVIISHWNLQKIEKAVRETAEFVNLYSKYRGQNRFVALIKTFELLTKHPAVLQSKVTLPDMKLLKKYIEKGLPLSNEGIAKAIKSGNFVGLKDILTWSIRVNQTIKTKVKKIPPFKWAVKSLKLIQKDCDVMCISQTPSEALVREWHENNIDQYVTVIAGQELGTKSDHIAIATKGRYEPANVIIIGDALGDKKAAKDNNACFYPICPGKEEISR